MERKFECHNCNARFDADDARQVQCPKCGSDNVEYAHFHIPSKAWKALCVALAVLFFVVLAINIDWGHSENQGGTDIVEKDSMAIGRDTAYIKETGLNLPPVINVGELMFEGKGYKFNVTVDNPPMVKFYYAIVDPYNDKNVIAKNENGSFADVPYSNADGGMYEVSLLDASVDTIICSIEKTGFIKQQSVSIKMTTAELQSKIDSRDASLMGVGENDYLNPDYELKLMDLSGDAVNIPSTLGEVFDKLENEIWESVKVNSLEYDDMNRISKIVLSVKEF